MFHWVKDFQRIFRYTTLDGIEYNSTFKEMIDSERVRAAIRRHNTDKSDRLSKAVDPGNLKKQKEWILLQRSLRNYLSTILGQNRVSLSYAICENPDPKYYGEDDKSYYFEKFSINCSPLSGLVYNTDSRKVHQMIHGFFHGCTADTWIKPR